MKNFGAALRERRKLSELKVYELAKKVGVNPVYITQIEKHGMLPSLYEQFMKEDINLAFETNKIADDIAVKKNKTPEEMKEFTKRIRNVIIKTRESIDKFKKILVRLENIEEAHLKLKNTPQLKYRSKV